MFDWTDGPVGDVGFGKVELLPDLCRGGKVGAFAWPSPGDDLAVGDVEVDGALEGADGALVGEPFKNYDG